MKGARIAVAIAVLLASCFIIAQVAQENRPLAGYFPGGALLYVEAADFSSLVGDWNASPEKAQWLKSPTYKAFSNSRLLLRLADAQSEFTSIAGLPADMSLVDSIAGGRSALAIYDIGKLEFLYVTRLAASRALDSSLFRARSGYEARNASGHAYYVRTDAATRKTAAFASSDGLLLLATREDLLANALTLLAGQPASPLTSEPWYDTAVKAAQAPGEVRMVMNIPALLATPYFRSYWIQRNTSELREFSAGVTDLFREAGQFREQRVLLRTNAAESQAAREPSVAQVLAYVPEGSGLYRAWAAPSIDHVLTLLDQKIVSPGPKSHDAPDPAPLAGNPDARAGSEADLETRIDQAPLQQQSSPSLAPFRALADRIGVAALLHVQSSQAPAGGVFIGNETAIVLLGNTNWPEAQVRPALPSASIHVQARVLVVASSPELLKRVVDRLAQPAAPTGATYIARYDHAREFQPFGRMMRMIDRVSLPDPGEGSEPEFFSQTVTGIGTVLSRMQTATIQTHDTGAQVSIAMVYRTAGR